jgi:hypothetical protein
VIRDLEAAREAVGVAMRLQSEVLEEAVKDEIPRRTGETAESWETRKIGALDYQVYSDDPVARYLYEGTGIYAGKGPIKPRQAQALKFFWDKVGAMTVWKGDLETKQEKFLFARWAEERGMVPILAWPKGIKPDDYIDRAEDRAENKAQECMDRAMRLTGAAS